MDRQRLRIEEDLRGLIGGSVRCDPTFCQLFARDASLFQMMPIGVVRPRSTDDVVKIVQYANEHRIPLHARGAGTALAGGAVGPGLVVDFSSRLRAITTNDDGTVRVQPGAVLSVLNNRLEKQGRRIGPDPAKRNVTTLGGMIAVDASGSHWLRSGSIRKHVQSLEVVLADGTVLEVGEHAIEPRTDGGGPARRNELVRALSGLLSRHAAVIEENRPKSLVNASGYQLADCMHAGSLDLAKLLVGSEGTLALITAATLSTEPIPAHRKCLLFFFDRLEKAALAAVELQEFSPSACDLMDRRHLNLARQADVHYELMIPGAAEAVLLVEFEGEEEADVQRRASEACEKLEKKTSLAAGVLEADEPEDLALFWRLGQSFTPTLSRMKGQMRPVPFVEDFAVPTQHLPELLTAVQARCIHHKITASLFAHAGHGQVHLRPLVNMQSRTDRLRLLALTRDVYELVWKLDGTISGEHGDGLSRTPYLRQQYGKLCDVFRAVKHIFDPDGLLNPGKIVPTYSVNPMELLQGAIYPELTSFEKLTSEAKQGNSALKTKSKKKQRKEDKTIADAVQEEEKLASEQVVELQLAWKPGELTSAIASCNRCGDCRIETGEKRMCPIFHYGPREEASPRAKVNLLAAVLEGHLPSDSVTTEEFKNLADLCVGCHMCRLECAAEVDVPKMMIEAKAAYVRENGMSLGTSMLAQVDRVCSLASRFRLLSNWAIGNRFMRWLAEKTVGLSLSRTLPTFAKRSFLQTAKKQGLTKVPGDAAGPHVAYFVDTFASYFDVQLAEALTAVLQHNGVTLFVPPDQHASAMPLITHGAVEKARKQAERNVAAFAEVVRNGYTVVTTEPSAALALSHEYLNLLPNDEDAALVAEATHDACHFLWKLHLRGALKLDFKPLEMSVGYHVPCHVKALSIGTPTENLLRLIPSLEVTRWEKGCSGMAGTYGLAKQNFRDSLRIGLPLITTVRESSVDCTTTECCTCKMQMEHGTTKRNLHPIKLLALAYGLMPELAGEVVGLKD